VENHLHGSAKSLELGHMGTWHIPGDVDGIDKIPNFPSPINSCKSFFNNIPFSSALMLSIMGSGAEVYNHAPRHPHKNYDDAVLVQRM